jgi:hypothetical protein
MKKEASAFSILVETLMESSSAKKQENEKELGVILVFVRKIQSTIQELQGFNEATDKNPELLQKLKTLIG